MKINERIEKYLNEEKLNEGYHPDVELERYERNIIDYFNMVDEVMDNEGAKPNELKKVNASISKAKKILNDFKKEVKSIQKTFDNFG